MKIQPIRSTPLVALLIVAAIAACRAQPVDPATTHPLPPVAIRPLAEGEPALRFLAVGDTGTGGRGQRAVATAMADKAARDGCDFVLLLGDNFYPAGVDAADSPRFERDFEQVYVGESLGVPFFVTLGNHDHNGSIDAEIERTRLGTRWCMPGRHYSFAWPIGPETTAAFFTLDTTPIAEGSDEGATELAWLDLAISRSHADWNVVFGHHPVEEATDRGQVDRVRAALGPILRRHHVDLYLAGHDHSLQLIRSDAPDAKPLVVIAGGGAGGDNSDGVDWSDRVDYAATGGGFAALRLTPTDLTVEFVRTDGTTQFAKTIAVTPAKEGVR